MENSGVLTGTTYIYSNTLSVKGKGGEGGRERREREREGEEREGEEREGEEREGEEREGGERREREREEREGVVGSEGRGREWWAVREEG